MRRRDTGWFLPVALLVLMLTSSMPAGAFHYATAVDEETPGLPTPSAPDEPPETGLVEIDQRLSELYSQTTEAIEGFEADAQQALGSLAGKAPVRAIDLLRDSAEPGKRHGGIGPWEEPEPWHRSNASARDWTWRFGNETTGAYPSTEGAMLLSPVIDLSTLGPYTDFVPAWRSIGPTGDHDLFTLFLVHKFNLANGRGRGLDGGHVRVFMNLSEEAYASGGTIVNPETGPAYEAYVQALGDEGFSGSTNWTVSTFDLSAFAGHRIRVGFQVATVPFQENSDRFEDDSIFDPDDEKGWLIDEARITGPAVANNVQVEPFRSPQRPSDAPMPRMAPGETPDVRIPVANLGANPETVDLTYQVRANHPDARDRSTRVLHEQTEQIELAPGEVFLFQDQGWTPGQTAPEVTWLGLTAEPARTSNTEERSRLATQPSTQWLPVNVSAEPDLRYGLDSEPVIGQPGEERTITFRASNEGNDDGFVQARLEVHHREDPDDDWDNRTDDLLGDAWGPRFLGVPAHDVAKTTWTITPPEAGAYRLILEQPHADGGNETDLERRVYAGTGPTARDLLEPLRDAGPSLPDCPTDLGWACTRPETTSSSSPVRGSIGPYWQSPPSWLTEPLAGEEQVGLTPGADLVGTPPASLVGPCHRADEIAAGEPQVDSGYGPGDVDASDPGGSSPVNASSEFSPSDCLVGLQRQTYDWLRGVEPGPGGPVDTVVPGYMDLELDIRYRAMRIPVTESPQLQIEMASSDPIRFHTTFPLTQTSVNGVPILPGPVREAADDAITSPLHVQIDLPVSNGTADDGILAEKLEAGWREIELDLDERIEAATGVKNIWDLSLEEVRITRPGVPEDRGTRAQFLLDHLEITGIPVETPSERRTLLRTTADPTERVGEWACRYPENPAPRSEVTVGGTSVGCPLESSEWSRVDPAGANTTGDDAWEREGGTWHYAPTSGNPVDARLVTGPVELSNGDSAKLLLRHEYGTPAEAFKYNPDTSGTYELKVAFLVEVQYKQGDRWSPFYILEPEGGYPTPYLDLSTGERRVPPSFGLDRPLRPGTVFYWPDGKVTGPADLPWLKEEREAEGSPNLLHTFPLQSAPGMGPPVDLDGRTVRFAFHVLQTDAENTDQAYWTLHELELWDQDPLARNVRVVDTSMRVRDQSGEVKLGPGADVPVEILVENAGLFDEPEVDVTLNVSQDGEEVDLVSTTLKRLPAGANRSVALHWTVDEDAESMEQFNLSVEAKPTETRDLSSLDNREQVGTVRVSVDPDIRTRTVVAPSVGTTDQVFSLDTRLENTGNTPLEDIEIRREIWRLGTSPVLVRQDRWTLQDPLPTSTHPVSLRTGIDAVHQANPAGSQPHRWTPDQPGSYRVLTEAVAEGTFEVSGERPELTYTDSRVLQVLEKVLQDGFEGDRLGGRPGVPWTTTGTDAWDKRRDAGFRSSTSWWIGADESGYPHEADTALVSPPVDLSSAKSAFLTLAANYSTEPFYDGAVVEATTDGGRTWTPLVPGTPAQLTGYPDELSPASPAGSRDDRGRPVGGFSGSLSPEDRLDGWTLQTFPLSQLDALVEKEAIAELVPPNVDNGSLQKLGFQYTRPSWKLGTGPNADRFILQNLTEFEPRPRTGGTMWYTGPVGRTEDDHKTSLALDLDLPPDPEHQYLQVRFEDWRPGVTPYNRTGTGACYEVTLNDATQTLETPPPPITSAWTPRWLNFTLPTPPPSDLDLEFEYDASLWENTCLPVGNQRAADTHAPDVTDNRGWAIDRVSIRYVNTTTDDIEHVVTTDLHERASPWTVLNPPEGARVRWHRAQGPSPVEGGWKAVESTPESKQGDSTVWTLRSSGGTLSLPPNQNARLVSPTIDLRGVGQRDVAFHLSHDYRFQARGMRGTPETITTQGSSNVEPQVEPTLVEGGVVEVQLYNETAQSFEPWQTLFQRPVDLEHRRVYWGSDGAHNDGCNQGSDSGPEYRCEIMPVNASSMRSEGLAEAVGYPFVTHSLGLPFDHVQMNLTYGSGTKIHNRTEEVAFLYTGDGRRTDRFDLSWLSGKRFRLGFHSWANPSGATIREEQEHWTILDARVLMDSFTADTVQTRIRFGSDASIAGDHFAVDDVSISQVSYDRNLALNVDTEEAPRAVEPGSIVWINGTVQNRGRAARDGFAVRVSSPGLPAGLQRAPGHENAQGKPGDPLPARTGSLSVAPAGTQGDTVGFAIPILVPGDVLPAQGALRARIVSLPDASSKTTTAQPLVDEVAGNKLADVPVTLGSIAAAELNLSLEPRRSRVGNTVTLTANVENTGTRDLSPRIHVNVTDPTGHRVLETSTLVTLLPGATHDLQTSLTPTVPGIYRVQASLVGPTVSQHTTDTLPVNASIAPISTSWEAGNDWLTWQTETVDETCKTPAPNDRNPPPSPTGPGWARVEGEGISESWGILFGAPAGSTEAPPTFLDGGLVSPPIDLPQLEEPSLTLIHRPHFYREGAGAILEVRVLNRTTGDPMFQSQDPLDNCRGANTVTANTDGWFLLRPETGYTSQSMGTTGSPGPQGGPTPSDLSPLGIGHPLIGGVSPSWRQFRADLTNQNLITPDGPLALEEQIVQFRLRGTTREHSPAAVPGEGWNVDSLVVGSAGLDVLPDTAQRTLVDGARKAFALDVTNPGDRLDTYQVQIAEQGTTLPAEWVDFAVQEIDVPAGETRPINVSVQVPVSENNQRATYDLTLALTSTFDPALVDFVRYRIDVVPSLHSNLVARIAANGDQVETGETTLLSTTVTNTGLTANTPAKAEIWVESPRGVRSTVAEREIPPIEPSRAGQPESTSLTVPWTAPSGDLGAYQFGVTIDPENRIVEFNETDNEATDTIEVVPLQRPDLVVEPEDLRVLHVDGSPLQAADPGDLIQVLVSVHNEGNEPAQRAKASLAMGPEPVAQRIIDRLPSGTTRTFPFTVFAPGNTTVLSLDVTTLDAELDEDNNQAQVVLPVRRAQLSITPADGEIALQPGNDTRETLDLVNTGSDTTLVRLDSADPDFTLDTSERELLLEPGHVRPLDVRLGVDATVEQGSTQLPIRVTDVGAGRSATLEVPVTVEEEAALEVNAPASKTVGLDPFAFTVHVENTGNVPLTPRPEITAPAGWGTPPSNAQLLEPGEAREVNVRLTPPNGTLAGTYPVRIGMGTTDGPQVDTTTDIHLEPTAAASIRSQVVSAGTHPVVHVVELENTGNVPATVALDLLEAPIGWNVATRDPVAKLQPGQTSEAKLVFTKASEDAPQAGAFLARARLSPEGPVDQPSLSRTFTGSLNALPPDVTITSVEATPQIGIEEGDAVRYDVTVENRGLGPAAPVPVRLYRNDELVNALDVSNLPAGAKETLNFTIQAKEGLQTIVASADPHQRLVDRDPSNNALGTELVAEGRFLPRGIPSVGPALVALAVGAMAVLLRRREER